jgi:hypothetical protein
MMPDEPVPEVGRSTWHIANSNNVPAATFNPVDVFSCLGKLCGQETWRLRAS